MPTEHALVLVTCGSEEEAGRIARTLVEQGLAAGVQTIPIGSVYHWAGAMVEDREWLLLVKTRRDRCANIEDIVHRIHSYEVPPVLMVEMTAASPRYLEWIDSVVAPDPLK